MARCQNLRQIYVCVRSPIDGHEYRIPVSVEQAMWWELGPRSVGTFTGDTRYDVAFGDMVASLDRGAKM